jgi:hypothetical protein
MIKRRTAAVAMLACGLSLGPGFTLARAQTAPLPYPDVADVSHATPEAARMLKAFFTAKSAHKADQMMTHFSRQGVLYIDASSGGIWPSWESLDKIFTGMMPKAPPAALSYPVRIYGDRKSALVAFTDTPELFGGRELRILGAVSFDGQGRIIRWMDYWDARSSQRKTAIGPNYPSDFHDDVGNATGRIADTAARLQAALSSGDAKAAAALFSADAVYEDMALHAQLLGRLAIERYLSRALGKTPYSAGASVAHVVGADAGGGYEWHAAPGFPQRRGNTALELDKQGQITRLTVVYDSGLFTDDAYRALVQLAAEN